MYFPFRGMLWRKEDIYYMFPDEKTSFDQMVAQSFKSIARDTRIKSYIQNSPELYPLLWRAAQLFVAGEIREEALIVANLLMLQGYLITLECIGENISTEEGCTKVKDEFLTLIKEIPSDLGEMSISLDLSHIGLNITPQLALEHLYTLLEAACSKRVSIILNMEESRKITDIFDVYKKATLKYENIGITIQAYLHRTIQDIHELLCFPGKIRITKGAYQEDSSLILTDQEKLNERYLNLVNIVAERGHSAAIATHNDDILREVIGRGYLHLPNIEVEMLYGVRPALIKQLKEDKYKARIYLPYGTEWYLYLCHRLAECPSNIYQAFVTCVNPSFRQKQVDYY